MDGDANKATDDPQFTHGKLLKAATLLRLPVDHLAERLGLEPVVATAASTPNMDVLAPTSRPHGTGSGDTTIWNAGYRPPSWHQDQSIPLDGSWESGMAPRSPTEIPRLALHSHSSPGAVLQLADQGRLQLGSDVSSLRENLSASPGHTWHSHSAPSSTVGRPPSGYHLTVHRRNGTPSSSVSRDGTATTADAASSSWITPGLLEPDTLTAEKKRGATSHGSSSEDLADDEFAVSQEEVDSMLLSSANASTSLGPCSRVWTLPPRIQRKKKAKTADDASPPKRRRSPGDIAKDGGPKRRGAYTDETKKRNTALTRILKSCIRCRMNRSRCNPDPEDPCGPCLTCKRMTGPTLCKLPCYRYIITDASLYREQRAPFQVYSKRWQTMDIVNIPPSDWASSEVKSIVVSPNHIDAPFEFKVREFIPAAGDLLEEQWVTATGTQQKIAIPKYAIAEMHETAIDLKAYIERNVWNYIDATVQGLDPLFWETYFMAFRHIGTAKTPEEQSLLTNTFRLWVMCRLTSNPVHICGDEKLGGHAVYSPDSLHNGKYPMPVIMTAQFECINYTTFLRPWSKSVLKQLNELVLAKKREYWLTVYYTMFILLHSCAMLTRRDEETARQYNMKERYANPESIRAHHAGVQTMLAHFHFINKGVAPFSLSQNEIGRQELAKAAELDDEQLSFIWRTSVMIKDPQRAATTRQLRQQERVGADLYWVSMLFDEEWKPKRND